MHPSRLQVCYQRNMLIGLSFAAILSFGVGSALHRLGSGKNEIVPALPVFSSVVVRDTAAVISEDRPARRLRRNVFDPRMRQHEGFLGFTNLRPEQNVHTPTITCVPALISLPETDEFETADVNSFSLTEGTDTGVYIPSNVSFIPGPFDRTSRSGPVNLSVQVAHRVDPEYPYVARDAYREGQIIALVYVDSTGLLTSFPDWIEGELVRSLRVSINGETRTIDYALVEDPPGWFFAENFLKVLPRWRFVPRIENSQPVGSLLRIRYRFRLSADSAVFELTPEQL